MPLKSLPRLWKTYLSHSARWLTRTARRNNLKEPKRRGQSLLGIRGHQLLLESGVHHRCTMVHSTITRRTQFAVLMEYYYIIICVELMCLCYRLMYLTFAPFCEMRDVITSTFVFCYEPCYKLWYYISYDFNFSLLLVVYILDFIHIRIQGGL